MSPYYSTVSFHTFEHGLMHNTRTGRLTRAEVSIVPFEAFLVRETLLMYNPYG